MKAMIHAQSVTAQKAGRRVPFQTKMTQTVEMLQSVAAAFTGHPVLVVANSWFGNVGLWKPLAASAFEFQLLSRLRSNITLSALPDARLPNQRGRSCKYGRRLGSTTEVAHQVQDKASAVAVFLYGKHRQVLAYDQIVMLKNLRCPVRVAWVFRTMRWVALFTTDLSLSVQ